MILVFVAYFIFCYLKYPNDELCLNEGRYCNKQTPLHLFLKVFTSYYFGKEVLEKMILVPEKSLIFPKNFYMNYVPWKSKIIMYIYM